MSCLKYAGARYVIARDVLKHLKSSTLLTFFQVLSGWGLKSESDSKDGGDFKFNNTENFITFANGSQVFLRELSNDPSDPEFDKLGSTEFTGGFIDECSQVASKAKGILTSRFRYKLLEFDLIPKLLCATNPCKNFAYYDFYKPWKSGTLPAYRKFIPATVFENTFISPHYIENLRKLDKVSKQRLLEGNWEYDVSEDALFDFAAVTAIFTNSIQCIDSDKRYLSVDVARFGNDKTVVMVWHGLHVERVFYVKKQDLTSTMALIEKLCGQYSIPRARVVVDEDGVGGGIVDGLKGVCGFVNNSRALDNRKNVSDKPKLNYGNLKSQCYFLLAEKVNLGLVSFYKDVDTVVKESLIEELEQVRWKDADKDGRIYTTPKDQIKENLGRSPDFSDCMAFRMFFEVNKHHRLSISGLDFVSNTPKTPVLPANSVTPVKTGVLI